MTVSLLIVPETEQSEMEARLDDQYHGYHKVQDGMYLLVHSDDAQTTVNHLTNNWSGGKRNTLLFQLGPGYNGFWNRGLWGWLKGRL